MDYRKHMADVRTAAAARGATVTTYLATLTDGTEWVIVCEGDRLNGESAPVVVASALKVALGRLVCVPLGRSDERVVHMVARDNDEAVRLMCNALEAAYQVRLARVAEDQGEVSAAMMAPTTVSQMVN